MEFGKLITVLLVDEGFPNGENDDDDDNDWSEGAELAGLSTGGRWVIRNAAASFYHCNAPMQPPTHQHLKKMPCVKFSNLDVKSAII